MKPHIYTRSEPIMLPYYLRLVYLILQDKGYEVSQLFTGLDFGREQLYDEHYRLSIEQHEKFILHVLKLTQNPHFAIELSKVKKDAAVNFAMLTVINSGKISKALHLIERYNPIFTRAFSIQSREIDEQVFMEIEPHLQHDNVIYFVLSSFILFLDKIFTEALGSTEFITRVEWAIPKPAGFDDVQSAFRFPIAFKQPHTRIYLNKAHLDQPMQQADPQTVRFLMEMSERQLEEAEAEVSLVGGVKSILIEHVASPPKLDDAARMLGISSRGLRRKLAQSNTSYQKLLDAVRANLATKLLSGSTASIATIAYELGFDNRSDFARAFKKWEGLSPSAYRNNPD